LKQKSHEAIIDLLIEPSLHDFVYTSIKFSLFSHD